MFKKKFFLCLFEIINNFCVKQVIKVMLYLYEKYVCPICLNL